MWTTPQRSRSTSTGLAGWVICARAAQEISAQRTSRRGIEAIVLKIARGGAMLQWRLGIVRHPAPPIWLAVSCRRLSERVSVVPGAADCRALSASAVRRRTGGLDHVPALF